MCRFSSLSLNLPASSHPSPKISLGFLCFVGLSFFLLVLISPVFGVFLYVRNNLMTPSSSTMDWFVLCSVHDTRNIFLCTFVLKCIYAFCYVFVQVNKELLYTKLNMANGKATMFV